jgi:Predicted esterase
MKLSSLLALLVLPLSAFAAKPSDAPIVWNNPAPARPPNPDLHHRSFHSPSIGEEVGYNVYLPPGYNDPAHGDTRYPVLYFLHGATGNENSDAGGVAGLVSGLIAANKIPPVLCVFPNGGPYSGYRDHPNSKQQVETMIIRELLPLIDREFRTQPTRDARAIFGFSMGGAGAVRYALTYPDLFSAAGAWAGAFRYRTQPENTLPAVYAVDVLKPLAHRVQLLLVVGSDDNTLDSHAPVLTNLVAAKFPFTFELLPRVAHDPGAYYQHSGEKMLRFLTTGFPPR